MDFTGILSILNLILLIGGTIGGYFAIKSGISRAASEIQERVINALETEINTMRSKIEDIEEENKHLMLVIDIIIESLQKRGIKIVIEKTSVMIEDQAAKTSITTRIQEH